MASWLSDLPWWAWVLVLWLAIWLVCKGASAGDVFDVFTDD